MVTLFPTYLTSNKVNLSKVSKLTCLKLSFINNKYQIFKNVLTYYFCLLESFEEVLLNF